MRLRLDFTLDTIEERTKFLTEYLESIHFELTQEELEMAGNYIL